VGGAWSAALLLSEINRPSGESGIVSYLPLATLGPMSFPLGDADTFTFTVPSRDWRTALIVPFASDILLWRNDDDPTVADAAVQRYRVVGRTLGFVTTTFSASSYREVLAGRIFHDADQLDFPSSLSGTLEPSGVGWSVIQQEQAKTAGGLGIQLGAVATATHVQAWVDDVSGGSTPQHFFTIGEPVGPAIQGKLAGVEGGFDWDIIPDAAHPTTILRYSSWNVRGTQSLLTLTEANIDPSGLQLAQLASDYANVFRGEGGSETVDGATLPGVIVYVPSTGNPDGTEVIPTGRWEKSVASTDLLTSTQVAAWAAKQAALAQEIDTWTVPLRSGVWQGPGQLWKGDTVRLLLEFPTFYEDGTSAGTLLSVDATLRVLGLTVTVSASGAEQVTLTLNHPVTRFADGPIPAQLGPRLARLERRS
jgi:hypothetical protein